MSELNEDTSRVDTIVGRVFLSSGKEGKWRPLDQTTQVGPEDILHTGANGSVRIVFDEHFVMFLESGTELKLKELMHRPKISALTIIFELIKGAIESDVTRRDGTRFEVDTLVSVAAVKCTRFRVAYDPWLSRFRLQVLEGVCEVRGPHKTLEVRAGQRVTTWADGRVEGPRPAASVGV